MIRPFLIAILISVFTVSVRAETMEIRHVALREGSTLDQYALELLKFLVAQTGTDAKFISFQPSSAQTRREMLLKDGSYDIDWLGATAEIEERVPPVRFPILRGLLGHRVFITNKETSAKLSKDMTFDQLKAFSVVQGQGWGDIPILVGGGFTKMQTNSTFDNLFKMVDGGRADLFPRSIIEPYGELASRCNLGADYVCTDKNMMVDDKILVVYKLPMLYFVSPKRQDLINVLNTAFTDHYDAFLEFFNNHPLVKDSLQKMEGRKVFHIEENKSLSDATSNIPDKYWLSL
ncbi:conserved hypothetical protein [Hahella chejuensis KCTC 2396]|uniref:ABC-type amino acid transport/signal transduction systems, periplasmic component/domain n=1 Tax=Hahella chejuensis (strain KCTC 2396) TaxID=349521 RepID=Q2S8C5_HAHCH|nr:hypothetical protein [Hahella chejuensis]ABC33099.1 conserved hypothetical protein [Hahella chejuensis KCTC 2396]